LIAAACGSYRFGNALNIRRHDGIWPLVSG
jgi:hypothetical protein